MSRLDVARSPKKKRGESAGSPPAATYAVAASVMAGCDTVYARVLLTGIGGRSTDTVGAAGAVGAASAGAASAGAASAVRREVTGVAAAAAGAGREVRCGAPCTRADPTWTDADSVELERDSVSGAAAATP